MGRSGSAHHLDHCPWLHHALRRSDQVVLKLGIIWTKRKVRTCGEADLAVLRWLLSPGQREANRGGDQEQAGEAIAQPGAAARAQPRAQLAGQDRVGAIKYRGDHQEGDAQQRELWSRWVAGSTNCGKNAA